MSLDIFWFLPTHGDGHYLGSAEGPLWLLLVGAVTLIPALLALGFGYHRMGER